MAERPPPDPEALDPQDAALWGRLVETVVPLPGRRRVPIIPNGPKRVPGNVIADPRVGVPRPVKRADGTLDGSWDRRLARGGVAPERSIDLHGATLDRAYALIDGALDQAVRHGERVVLLVTGKARPEARGGRGAIRALVPDWLAHSRHAAAIAAVRPAHPRHGGGGALYVILRRR